MYSFSGGGGEGANPRDYRVCGAETNLYRENFRNPAGFLKVVFPLSFLYIRATTQYYIIIVYPRVLS